MVKVMRYRIIKIVNNTIFLILFMILISSTTSSTEDLLSLKWKYDASGSVTNIHLLNIDKEKRAVIASVSLYTSAGIAGWLTAIDKNGNLLWEKRGFPSITSMRVADIDKDGRDEIIAGVLFYVYCFDDNGNIKWKVLTDSSNTITSIEITDINNDGYDEIIVAGDSTISYNIHAIDRNGKILWKARAPEGVNSIAIGDIDDNKKPDIVAGTVGRHGVYYKSSFLILLNSSGKCLWKQRTKRGTVKIKLWDINNDGKLEIFLGSLQYLWVFDYTGNEIMNYETKGYINDIIVDDIDGNGKNDIILASNDLYVLNSDSSLKWTNSAGMESINDLEIIDTNQDNCKEILVASDSLYLVDCDNNVIWSYHTKKAVKTISIGDIDGDSFPEIMAGSLDNNVYVFTQKGYQMRAEAERYYSLAKNLYAAGNLRKALENAMKAMDYYQQLNDTEKISDIEKLVSLIRDMIQKQNEEVILAYSYYNRSVSFYLHNDYINASFWAKKAKYKYQSLHNETMVIKSENIINNSYRYMRIEAEKLLNNAIINYNKSNYSNAILNAEDSSRRYIWLGDRNKSIESLELIATIYTALAEKQRHAGDFENASIYAQKALFVYGCIEESPEDYPPDCIPRNVSIKDITTLADEIRNLTYNKSHYMNEYLYLKSIIIAISENNTGSFIDDVVRNMKKSMRGFVNNISQPVEYIIKLIKWNFKIILVVIALAIVIFLLIIFLFMVIKTRREPTEEFEEEVHEEEHEGKFMDDIEKEITEEEIYEEVQEEDEVEKIRKDKTRGIGVTLKSLRR